MHCVLHCTVCVHVMCTVLCDVLCCHVMPCDFMWCHVMWCRDVMSCYKANHICRRYNYSYSKGYSLLLIQGKLLTAPIRHPALWDIELIYVFPSRKRIEIYAKTLTDKTITLEPSVSIEHVTAAMIRTMKAFPQISRYAANNWKIAARCQATVSRKSSSV